MLYAIYKEIQLHLSKKMVCSAFRRTQNNDKKEQVCVKNILVLVTVDTLACVSTITIMLE